MGWAVTAEVRFKVQEDPLLEKTVSNPTSPTLRTEWNKSFRNAVKVTQILNFSLLSVSAALVHISGNVQRYRLPSIKL